MTRIRPAISNVVAVLPGSDPRLKGQYVAIGAHSDHVEAVNRARPHPFTFDYAFDAEGHPENLYCRSDHYMYARYGIPVVFFTTGLHQDYHQVTDEPQYIDYEHFANVTQLIHDVALRVANTDRRVVVDKPKPDPSRPCRQ